MLLALIDSIVDIYFPYELNNQQITNSSEKKYFDTEKGILIKKGFRFVARNKK